MMGAEIELLIIADDLTGANDAGAQFAKRGIRSVVVAQPAISVLPQGYPVVVVNTESRHVSPLEATARVRRVAKLGLSAGAHHFFKKTDSTLRGNIGAELKALLEATGENWLPFVPAFPEMGRTTDGGVHRVNGVKISETAFAHDPLSPVRESEVAKIVRANAPLRTLSCALPVLPDRPTAECVVVDCQTRGELSGIARELARRGKMRVMAGSAAFAEELPNVLHFPKTAPDIRNTTVLRGPILCVNGSLNPRALAQIAAAHKLFRKVKLDPEELLRPESLQIDLRLSGHLLICTVEHRDEVTRYIEAATRLGIAKVDVHLAVAERLGRIVRETLASQEFGSLVIFGGDTLMGIARAMGWTAFEPQGEIEPGVTVANPLSCEILVVSKAGGFGDDEVLWRIVARMNRCDLQ